MRPSACGREASSIRCCVCSRQTKTPRTSRWTDTETSVSWHTSTRARRPPLRGCCSTRGCRTRSARSMMVRPPWTGWTRRGSVASPSPALPPHASGTVWISSSPATASTSSTPRATSTSPSRSSGHCGCLMARSPSSIASRASSRRAKPSGGRQTDTGSPVWRSSTRWTVSAPTSTGASTRSATALAPTACPSSCPSALDRTLPASSTSSG
mmetsp:Transcript_28719/g.71655  ORF Transcript_28719/g.71655 Transcript_28719/m.71655 type:complete len:211 (-) Transcript_28719:2246-2878(-)